MSRRRVACGLAVAVALAMGAAGRPQAGLSQEVAPPRLTVTALANPGTTVLTAVSFPEPSTGYAVAADNSFFATADAGQTWTPVATPLPLFDLRNPPENGVAGFTDVDFTDADHGHAVTLGDQIIATADGGKSWVVQPTPRPFEVGVDWKDGAPAGWEYSAVSFVDPHHGFVVGNQGLILATTDGGATWRYQGNPLFHSLRDVTFLDTDLGQAVGYVIGRDEDAYLALRTLDGGATWTYQRTGSPGDSNGPVNFDAVAFTDPRHAVVAGAHGRIFVTFDNGKTWRNRRSGTQERLNSVAFADRRRGLAVGTVEFQGELRAQILATNDGGQSWQQRPTPEAADLLEVTFADRTTAYVVGCATPVGTCRQGAVLRVDFPELEPEVEQPSSRSSRLPLVLVSLAVLVGAGGIVAARRR